jgi:hypothetical protein
MKMDTIASPWRYDDGAESASGTMFMRRGCQQHCTDRGELAMA